jgi:putative Ca2+/H+ antiporter (TMEM165/GDT1 family)
MDWSVLFSTFGLVFVAELGDKTQLAVVTQTCKYRRPWAVFLGASLALAMVTVLGAIGGQLISGIVPENVLCYVAALLFVVMGMFTGWEAAKTQPGASAQEATGDCGYDESGGSLSALASAWDWRAFGSTLGLLFVAELGDKTQLAVLSLAGRCGSIWAVSLGGTMALISVTALGVIGGQGLCKLISERLLLGISALAFIVMGVLMGLGVF